MEKQNKKKNMHTKEKKINNISTYRNTNDQTNIKMTKNENKKIGR
ncbi:hypothetical protein GCM10020220_012770 [Nonomuraea rubra]